MRGVGERGRRWRWVATARIVLNALLAVPRVATLTVTEHNPFHGAADGSTTAALADALATALAE